MASQNIKVSQNEQNKKIKQILKFVNEKIVQTLSSVPLFC